jgi:hypothetical protein
MQIATSPMSNARNGKSVGSIVFIAVSSGAGRMGGPPW